MRSSLIALAFLSAAVGVASAQAVQPQQAAEPTPKRRTKAEKKAAKRARTSGVEVPPPATSAEMLEAAGRETYGDLWKPTDGVGVPVSPSAGEPSL